MNKKNQNISHYDLPIKEEYLKNIEITKHKTKRKRRLKKWVLFVFVIIFCSTFLFCLFILVNWNQDNQNTANVVKDIDDTITQVDEKNTMNVNEPKDKESDYWYYIKIPLIQVKFDELIKKNNDTVGWINVNHTNINYPFVQTSDNEYYLNHSYDKSKNDAGWVFLDFRNHKNLSDKNNVLYAHSRLDKTMFGSLSNVLKKNWYANKDNHVIKISTPNEDSLWQIFSVYVIKEETYYITTSFKDDEEYQNFLDTIKKRSKYNFNTSLNTNDKILTLSTCYSDTKRTVVHAKLIKMSKK
mgnify:FL=1